MNFTQYKPVFPVVESDWLSERRQVRFPRSKKKRIRRKWAKQQKNYRDIPFDHAYVIQGVTVAHPALAKRLREREDAIFQTIEGRDAFPLTFDFPVRNMSTTADAPKFDDMTKIRASLDFQSMLLPRRFITMGAW